MDRQFEEKLNALDLQPILFVLVRAEDGPKWTLRQSIIAEKWYKRFHALIHEYPSQTIVPTQVIDTIWHKHILDTQKYLNDCINLHGEIIHHFPYLGIRDLDDDSARRDNLYIKTVGLFIDMFGESQKILSLSSDTLRRKVQLFVPDLLPPKVGHGYLLRRGLTDTKCTSSRPARLIVGRACPAQFARAARYRALWCLPGVTEPSARGTTTTRCRYNAPFAARIFSRKAPAISIKRDFWAVRNSSRAPSMASNASPR